MWKGGKCGSVEVECGSGVWKWSLEVIPHMRDGAVVYNKQIWIKQPFFTV